VRDIFDEEALPLLIHKFPGNHHSSRSSIVKEQRRWKDLCMADRGGDHLRS
jgi:hypothetical protein